MPPDPSRLQHASHVIPLEQTGISYILPMAPEQQLYQQLLLLLLSLISLSHWVNICLSMKYELLLSNVGAVWEIQYWYLI